MFTLFGAEGEKAPLLSQSAKADPTPAGRRGNYPRRTRRHLAFVAVAERIDFTRGAPARVEAKKEPCCKRRDPYAINNPRRARMAGPSHQFDPGLVAGRCGETLITCQQRSVEHLGKRDIYGVIRRKIVP